MRRSAARTISALASLAMLLAVATVAEAQKNDKPRPFKGTAIGTLLPGGNGFDIPWQGINLGHGTHTGNYEAYITSWFKRPWWETFPMIELKSEVILVAADGSLMYQYAEVTYNYWTPDADRYGEAVVTGGTGRFAEASGWYSSVSSKLESGHWQHVADGWIVY